MSSHLHWDSNKILPFLQKTIDMLKFDIEFSEWPAFASMLKDKALKNVKQMAFEIHSWRDTKKDYIYFWQQLQVSELLPPCRYPAKFGHVLLYSPYLLGKK